MGSSWLRATNANDLVLPVQIVEPQADDFSGLRPFGTVSSTKKRGAMIPAASPARHQPRASANRKNGLRR
jgi:hypothetical protein